MGFSDRDIVALSGAHTLGKFIQYSTFQTTLLNHSNNHSTGRCHTDRSGFKGPWTFTPTRFSNQYFIQLTKNTWTKKKWDGPEQYEDPTGELMMLPTDMALLWDEGFKKYVDIYAKDKETFFKDFATAFGRMLELGVKRNHL